MSSSQKIIGKLCVDDEGVNVKNACVATRGIGFFYPSSYIHVYIKGSDYYYTGSSYGSRENLHLTNVIQINEKNITTIRDITDEIYQNTLKFIDSLEYAIKIGSKNLEDIYFKLNKAKQLKKDIEEIRKAEKEKKEVPKKKLPFIYYS
jgi:hypothetical protein